MSFQPIVPSAGYAGWVFFDRIADKQKEAFVNAPIVQNDVDYFRENATNISSSENLVSDRRLLSVVLGAFGLEDDINSKAFVKQLLDDGSFSPDALSNRLANKQYSAFVEAVEPLINAKEPSTKTDIIEDIIVRFKTRGFEKAVGLQNDDFRLSMNADRELEELSQEKMSNDAMWFTIMGNPPLRNVVEVALGLPESIGKLDIDQQLGIFQNQAEKTFGFNEITEFSDENRRDELVQRFLLMKEVSTIQTLNSSQIALQLLGGLG